MSASACVAGQETKSGGYLSESHELATGDGPERKMRSLPARKTVPVVVDSSFFDECRHALHRKATLAYVVGRIPNLRSIAMELFDSVEIEITVDPEIEDLQYIVFHVTTSVKAREAASLRREWYRKTHDALGDRVSLLRLTIDIT